MGITRNNRHKRRATGGKKKHYRKDRKFEMGHQPTNTKMGERKTSLVRMRGGKMKVRAIRLDAGNFSWASEGMGRKSRILGVKYNATSNELVRTNTLVKNAIIEIDASPFRLWYEQHYGIKLVKKKRVAAKKPVKPTGAAAKKGAKPAAGAKKGAAKKPAAAKPAAAKPAEKPKTEKPKTEKPKTEKPKTEKPKAEKPKTEAAKAPVAKESKPKALRIGKLGEIPQPTADFPYTRKTHSKAAAVVAAALLKRYKLSIRKRAKLVAKARRMQRAEYREERKFQKAKAAYLKAKAEGKAPAEFPYEAKKQLGQKIAAHFIASRQAFYRKKRPVRKLDAHLLEQFQTGRLFACIASRPGQDGCADGYILEGKELEFYIKKMKK